MRLFGVLLCLSTIVMSESFYLTDYSIRALLIATVSTAVPTIIVVGRAMLAELKEE